MYKLNYKKRIWIVKQYLAGVLPSKLCLAQNISRMSLSKIMRNYREFGFDGLKDHKTGRPETTLNQNAETIILDLRQRFGYGPERIEHLLKSKGFGISHRQIYKFLLNNNKIKSNIKKQKPRKWVRYELPNPNDLWHTDWTYDPFTQKQLSVYIDDKTRMITSYGIFKNALVENSLALLKTGIAEFGKPKSVMTDHGTQYYTNHAETQENNKFKMTLNLLGIKHYVARVGRPQTNGKVERFFLTYKTEYTTGTFNNIKDFIKHYNEARPHMSLNYKTPKEIWEELKNVN
jgi:transposase InsO family protein